MDTSKQRALIMTMYALKLVDLAISNNYILITSNYDCKNIVWDCQASILEHVYSTIDPVTKDEFFNNTELQRSYTIQLLRIAEQAVNAQLPEFSHITKITLNKIVVI